VGVNEQPEQPKWSKDKTFLFVAVMVLLMIVLPLMIIFYVAHKLSQIH
jgi:hypothetical protein